MISIVLLGAGNVASHFYNAFKNSDKTEVKQWYNRSLKPLYEYQNEVAITDNLKALEPADVYIIAVSDDSIGALSKGLPFKGRTVVHTSGSVDIKDLDRKHRRGVFYPLQTLSKDVPVNFENVPICLEVFYNEDFPMLQELAEAIGSPHYKINTEQRQVLHLSAVFVNNFTNQLYRIGHEISDAMNINFDILKPLILETATKIQSVSPYMAQTGPAKRDDQKTIQKHLNLIENPTHKAVYELLTQSINQTHGR